MIAVSGKVDYITLTTKGELGIALPALETRHLQGLMHYDNRSETRYYVHHYGGQGEMLVIAGQRLDLIRQELGLDDNEIIGKIDGGKCTRIDFAVDVYNSELTAIGLETMWKEGVIRTKTKKGTLIRDTLGVSGDTFYLGSLETRQKLFRGYEKSKKEKDFLNRFRLELQLGKDGGSVQSHGAIISGADAGSYAIGSVKNFLSPVEGSLVDVLLNAERVKAPVGRKAENKTQSWLLGMVTESILKESYKDPEFFSKFIDNLLLKMKGKEDGNASF